jgi:putative hydrolase of the HAD superfamily
VTDRHKELRGVLFDLDDTLAASAEAEQRVWSDVSELIVARLPGVERDELRRRYLDALHRHYPDLAAGRTDTLAFRRVRLADALEPWGELDDGLFEAYLAEKRRIPDEVEPFPEAIATLRALRGRGIRVGVLTNGPSVMQRRKLEVSRLGSELDAIAISEELGIAKPDEEAFRRALELLGTRAEETAMVGDSLENDVLGGLAAGLAAVVWIPGSREGELPAGAHLAREITEVPGLLGLG